MILSRFLVPLSALCLSSLLIGCHRNETRVASTGHLSNYPVTVESCGQDITFESPPSRAIAFDTNMTEIMLELGLSDRMVGYWISGVKIDPKYGKEIAKISLISNRTDPPPGLETIVNFDPDFVFGAWVYNFSEDRGVTPKKLAELGVKSYVLSESCVDAGDSKGQTPDVTLQGTYRDILNIGKIFDVEARANKIVLRMQRRIALVQKRIGRVERPLRGLYYGGGSTAAFTTGRYGMASKMMDYVGAKNILWNVEKAWLPSVGWEEIIHSDPEFIMIDDTPWESAAHRIKTLRSLPQLAKVTAIKQGRFIVFPWREILPGVSVDKGIARLAAAIYPSVSFRDIEDS